MRFFFYGTLIDPDVRRVVLGANAARVAEIQPGVLKGWERRAVRGASYPIILPRARGRVHGLLARGLDAQAARRLQAYEGTAYERVTVEIALDDGICRRAFVFAASHRGRLKPAMSAWEYPAWRARHKTGFMREIARFQR